MTASQGCQPKGDLALEQRQQPEGSVWALEPTLVEASAGLKGQLTSSSPPHHSSPSTDQAGLLQGSAAADSTARSSADEVAGIAAPAAVAAATALGALWRNYRRILIQRKRRLCVKAGAPTSMCRKCGAACTATEGMQRRKCMQQQPEISASACCQPEMPGLEAPPAAAVEDPKLASEPDPSRLVLGRQRAQAAADAEEAALAAQLAAAWAAPLRLQPQSTLERLAEAAAAVACTKEAQQPWAPRTVSATPRGADCVHASPFAALAQTVGGFASQPPSVTPPFGSSGQITPNGLSGHSFAAGCFSGAGISGAACLSGASIASDADCLEGCGGAEAPVHSFDPQQKEQQPGPLTDFLGGEAAVNPYAPQHPLPPIEVHCNRGDGSDSSNGTSIQAPTSPPQLADLRSITTCCYSGNAPAVAEAAAVAAAASQANFQLPLLCSHRSGLGFAAAGRSLSLPTPETPRVSMDGDSSTPRHPAPLAELLRHRARQDGWQALAGSGCATPCRPSLELAPSLAAWSPCPLPPELHKWAIDLSEVTLLRWPNGKLQRLGAGASGDVFRATYRGEMVAVKALDIGSSSPELQLAFVTEAMRMELLRHPNVVSFYGVCINPQKEKGLLVLECCEGRDLCSALQLTAAPPAPPDRIFGWHLKGRRVALEVAKALNYLHAKGIVHLDVKASNVLLTGTGTAKLADMGLARLKHGTFLSEVAPVGTFAWTAPEVLLGQQCNQSADIYGFGVLLWEICTGEPPMRGRLRLPAVPEECPQEVADLMMKCLSAEPAQRPSAEHLVHQLSILARARPAVTATTAVTAPAAWPAC